MRTDTFCFPVWEAKIFEVQLMGLCESLGFAIGTGCVGFLAAGIVACVVLFFPLLGLAYILHLGVIKHARFVPAEGTFFSRFREAWRESGEKRRKRFLCVPYGFLLALQDAFAAGNERGEWEPIEPEEDEQSKDAGLPPFYKNPFCRFLNRFGPMFKDYTAYSW